MNKTLTTEAKIHLATKVDSYKIYPNSNPIHFTKDYRRMLSIQCYNPNQLDTCPFAGKYLRDLVIAISVKDRFDIEASHCFRSDRLGSADLYLVYPEDFITEVLKVTGFDIKGAWEK